MSLITLLLLGRPTEHAIHDQCLTIHGIAYRAERSLSRLHANRTVRWLANGKKISIVACYQRVFRVYPQACCHACALTANMHELQS